MSNTDLFAAIDKYMKNSTSIEWESGTVQSVGSLTAQVLIGGSGSAQACAFNNDTVVTRGDEVLLSRNKKTRLWVINQVIGNPRSGNSVPNRPTPNNAPGSPHWAAINLQQGAGLAWSGTALTLITSVTKSFTGGTPFLIYNGYVTPGASDVQMDIGWGEGADYQVVYRATIKSTSPYTAINISDFMPGYLHGAHTFNIRAQLGTAGITPTLNCLRFTLGEL